MKWMIMEWTCNTGSDGGSDSDATTTSSTEHLTREEKLYVLRHTPRQEPQGQESKSWQQQQQRSPSCRSCSQHQRSGSVNRLESSSSGGGGSGGPDPASSCRTLIIHGSLSDESWARYDEFFSHLLLLLMSPVERRHGQQPPACDPQRKIHQRWRHCHTHCKTKPSTLLLVKFYLTPRLSFFYFTSSSSSLLASPLAAIAQPTLLPLPTYRSMCTTLQ